MILILGKINKANSNVEPNQINFALDNNSKHQYIYQNNNIYFVVLDSSNEIEKYITLAKDIEQCAFRIEENKVFTSIKISGITYNNSFYL